MKIAVIGATGMIGSALVEELLNRGQRVTGIARGVEKLPQHSGLTPKACDLMKLDQLAEAIAGHDVVISAFSPGHGLGPEIYKGLVEAGWKIKRAFKQVNGRYLINVGGASSLWLPSGYQMLEDSQWPNWYFNAASLEHLNYLHQVSGVPIFAEMVESRKRILADPALDPVCEWPEEHLRQFVEKLGGNFNVGEGGRAQLELFRHDMTLRWSFVSPPWFLRPGPRSGRYRTTVDTLPLEAGIPAGISVADLAVAIADESEKQQFVHQHWSAARQL